MDNTLTERSLGSSPISANLALGSDLRAGETFEALQNQIDRLNDIHASSSTAWPIVVQLAGKILREEGKDLACGTWLTLGLFHQRGLPGLADGIHMLRELVETYWETMSPPVNRIRGRRNQMQWLLDQLSAELDEQAVSQMPALDNTLHAEMLEDWNALDAFWQDRDDQAPAFYGLAAVLRRLPAQTPVQSEPVSVADQGAQAVSSEPAAAPVNMAGSAPAAATVPPSATNQAPSLAVAAAVPASADQANEAVEKALATLQPLVDWFVQELPTAPILFRLNRICAWTTLERAPLAEGRATRLPPPAGQLIDSFEQVVQIGEPEAVVRFAESRLAGFPCWLDLNRASHQALTQLGAGEAAAAVAFEVSRLNARLPQLAQLTFNDGRSFADSATQAWLQGLGAASAATASSADAITTLIQDAESKAADGRLNEALEHLQSAMVQADSRRTSFRLRLAQCSLIHRFDAKTDLRALMLPLLEDIDAHHLEGWEPELGRQALTLAAGIELRYGANDVKPAVSAMLGRLSRVDVGAAWQLSQSTTS